MSYGINIYLPDGLVIGDTTDAGSFVEQFTLGINEAGGSRSYPQLAGFNDLRWIQFQAAPATSDINVPIVWHQLSASYSSGYPILTWTLPSGTIASTTVLVYVR